MSTKSENAIATTVNLKGEPNEQFSSSQPANSQEASNAGGRNALGDIGNKILGKSSLARAKESVKENKTVLTVKSHNHVESMAEIESSEEEEGEQQPGDILLVPEIARTTINVEDIDQDDVGNTQLVSEYVKDIYVYLRRLEAKFGLSPTFLSDKQVTSKMRSVLIDWLIQVHLKFHLLNETLFLCVQIIDAYLAATDVSKMQLQLVGVTAMFVASKYEEMYVPAIDDFVYMTDNTYTKQEIRHMEMSILRCMNFLFAKPLPLHFLRRCSKAGRVSSFF